jgi:hypothetical protein
MELRIRLISCLKYIGSVFAAIIRNRFNIRSVFLWCLMPPNSKTSILK